MALEASPWIIDGTTIDAETIRRAVGTLINPAGGVVTPGDLTVAAQSTPNMSCQVGTGQAWVAGTSTATQSLYYAMNKAAVTVSISAANPSNPRLDQIIVQVLDKEYAGDSTEMQFAVVVGTPTSGASLTNLVGLGSVPASSLVLAYVLVPAGTTAITTGDISNLVVPVGPGKMFTGGAQYSDFTTFFADANAHVAGPSIPFIVQSTAPASTEVFPASGWFGLHMPSDTWSSAYGLGLWAAVQDDGDSGAGGAWGMLAIATNINSSDGSRALRAIEGDLNYTGPDSLGTALGAYPIYALNLGFGAVNRATSAIEIDNAEGAGGCFYGIRFNEVVYEDGAVVQSLLGDASTSQVQWQTIAGTNYTTPLYQWDASGRHQWSDGAAGYDVDLYRASAGVLASDNTFQAFGLQIEPPSSNAALILNAPSGHQASLILQQAGTSEWQIGLTSTADEFFIYNVATSTNVLTVSSGNIVQIPGTTSLCSAGTSEELNFFNAGGAVQQTVSGSRGSATATVLENLLNALGEYGLINNATTS
ncbi:MAG: hypothetical protein ACLP01_16690 [Solirubrobacteraceae bacterium]